MEEGRAEPADEAEGEEEGGEADEDDSDAARRVVVRAGGLSLGVVSGVGMVGEEEGEEEAEAGNALSIGATVASSTG
jgi:hypothetical protein